MSSDLNAMLAAVSADLDEIYTRLDAARAALSDAAATLDDTRTSTAALRDVVAY